MTLDELIAADLERDEDRVAHVYKDSLGYDTIGVGHLVDARKGGGLPDHIITILRDYDIDEKRKDLDVRLSWWRTKPPPIQRALVNMAFQLGGNLYSFHRMLNALYADDYVTAVKEGRDSIWHQETPERAERVLALFMEAANGAQPVSG